MSERGTPRASYSCVIVGYVDHGNRAAGKKFDFDESCIRRWRVQREKLTKTPKMKRAIRSNPWLISFECSAHVLVVMQNCVE